MSPGVKKRGDILNFRNQKGLLHFPARGGQLAGSTGELRSVGSRAARIA
jgi:hypothetical protein